MVKGRKAKRKQKQKQKQKRKDNNVRRNKPVTTKSDLKIKPLYNSNKPRHGIKFECEFCGFKLVGGGYETLKKRNYMEKEARKEHDKIHKEMLKSGRGRTITVEEGGQFVQKIPPLKIIRSSHKVEAEHTFISQTTNQSTTSTTYVTPTGCTIASGAFSVGETYLHLVTAHFGSSSTSDETFIRCVSGSSVHNQSIMATEIDSSSARHTYMWWVIRTAVSGEDFHVEFQTNGSATANIDQVCISVLRLTPDLVQGTDWDHSSVSSTVAMTPADTDTSSGNASVTITPATASHRWLILSKARYGTGITNATSCQSRISRSGEASDNDMIVQQEGEDATNSIMILCGARTDTLGAQSNTYTEISKGIATTTYTTTNRLNSGIFILDLDRFKNVAVNLEDTGQEEPNSTTTPHGVLVHSQAVTTEQTGDVFVLAHTTMDAGGSGNTFTMRLQVNNADQPGTQSTDDYNFLCWTTEDRVCWATHTILDNVSAATYTADIDGSVSVTGSSRGTYTRLLTLFSLEFAGANAITNVKNETEAITENVVRVIGTAGKQVKNETEAITENVVTRVTSTLVLIQDENIKFCLSGGSTNVDPLASIGGARSTATTGGGAGSGTAGFLDNGFLDNGFILTDSSGSGGTGGIIINKLFDDVTLTEASIGDIEYRCMYILNAHGSLTASNVKVWIPVNTPANDEIDIALGSAGVNGIEQGPLASENTTPSTPSLTFVTANSEATAIDCGTIPAGQHRGIWLRRTVPSNTSYFPNNTYQLQVSLYSDHS